MKKSIFFLLATVIIMVFSGCKPADIQQIKDDIEKPEINEEIETADTSEVASDIKDYLYPCDVTEDLAGQVVKVLGTINYIDESDPNGKFIELKKDNCGIGVWINNFDIDKWDEESKKLIKTGQQIIAEGNLEAYEGEPILEVFAPLKPGNEPDTIEESSVEQESMAEEDPEGTPDEKNQEETQLIVEDIPEVQRLNVHVIDSTLNGQPGLCYLGSFAMLVKYHNPDMDFADVLAYSGIGSNAINNNIDGGNVLTTGIVEAGIIYGANNLNSDYIIGAKRGGFISDPYIPPVENFEDYAYKVLSFADEKEALLYLKSLLTLGYPVDVALNTLYIYDDLSKASDFWKGCQKEETGHFLVVTGYDKEFLYLNDPNGYSDIPVKIDNFMLAWEKASELEAPPLGPYWMFALIGPGNTKDGKEIIEWNLEISRNTTEQMERFALDPSDSPFTRFSFREIATARINYAGFLTKHGFDEAAELYNRSTAIFSELGLDESSAIDPGKIQDAADLEGQAHGLLKQ